MDLDRGELKDVDGYTAVLLWTNYTRLANTRALEKLLVYNTEEVINLQGLMVVAYNMPVAQTPFDHLKLNMPGSPQMPC